MSFEWPYLLVGLALVPLLIGLYLLAQRRRRRYVVSFTNVGLLSQVMGRGPGIRRHVPPLLFLLGLTVLLVGVARPMAVIPVPRDEGTVMMVMDSSGSMAAPDLEPNRMEAAKSAGRQLIDNVPDGVRLGLVTFSGAANLIAEPTDNHQTLVRAIAGLRAEGGTAIGDGLSLAIDNVLAQQPDENEEQTPSLIILLSDGQSSSGIPPAEAAAQAKAAGIRVHTVGIGQRDAQTVVGGQSAVLDEATLQMIASETGGQYFYAAESEELEDIYADLGAQVGWTEERTEVTALFSAFGSMFMVAAGLLGLRWFQRLP
jgi:Ca-activated chloride channel family protein